ncbi:MAG: YcgL domain-containing protein [Pseudomonadota bacterium]
MSDRDELDCWIYRSPRKPETYLYLTGEMATKPVPPGLLAAMAPLELVMQLTLHPERKLARASATRVMADLRAHGFYLQMPPNEFEKLSPNVGGKVTH